MDRIDRILDYVCISCTCIFAILLFASGNFQGGFWAIMASLWKLEAMKAKEGWSECLRDMREIVMRRKCQTAGDPENDSGGGSAENPKRQEI